MDFDGGDNSKELWEWQKEEFSQKSGADTSHRIWDELEPKEDGLIFMLGEQTPVKECGDFQYLISENSDDQTKSAEDRRECSQMKRRRMLQYNSSDTEISINDELLSSEFMKSKIGEDTLLKDGTDDNLQWILGLSEATDSHEDLDQSSERWLESCFNDSEIHASSDQMIASCAPNYHSEASDKLNPQRRMRTFKLPVTISITPCSKNRGTLKNHFFGNFFQKVNPLTIFFCLGNKSYLSSPAKMASSIAYPFALIKPCGVQGDTTLKDINQRIHTPSMTKQSQTLEDLSQMYPTSAFSGKPVVVKTKIRTEGGKGSITIMRTKG